MKPDRESLRCGCEPFRRSSARTPVRGTPIAAGAALPIVMLPLVIAVSACNDPAPPTAAEERQGPSRMDTPWRQMSDAELAARIAEAGGKVSIGFKDSSAAGGVDDSGLVLASPTSISAGKALLRDIGVEITFEFTTIPAVVGRMPPALLPALRRHPLIDYIDPIFGGTRHAQGG